MTDVKDFIVKTSGGLSVRGARYAGGPKTPAICIPGLTRNAADFSDFAQALAATGRDVYALSLRGRGRSDYDPNYLNYVPPTYLDDVFATLDHFKTPRAIFVGTSLGGIVTMLAASKDRARVAAAIINDVGPELAPEGIARIGAYVAARAIEGDKPVADIDAAIAAIKGLNEPAFPGRDRAFWEMFARRTFRINADGSWTLDYDPKIGRALLEAGPAPDLWPAFAALAGVPTLLLRGAISDLLTPLIIGKMRAAMAEFDYCEVEGVGHAPTLTEPDAFRSITDFLKRI